MNIARQRKRWRAIRFVSPLHLVSQLPGFQRHRSFACQLPGLLVNNVLVPLPQLPETAFLAVCESVPLHWSRFRY